MVRRSRLRISALLVLIELLVPTVLAATSTGAASADAPVVGKDHWHAAFGVWNCGTWLATLRGRADRRVLNQTQQNESSGEAGRRTSPLRSRDLSAQTLSSDADPTGIHTHGDGLVHTHPVGNVAEGKNAILQKFFDVVGVKITSTAVSIEGHPTIKVGGNCKGEKSVVRTLVWSSVTSKSPKVFKVDPGLIALRDRQLIAVVIGGPTENPGLPPMKVGGVRRLVLPPTEGIGPSGNGNVKGDDTIVFDIQLVAVAN